MLMGYIKNRQKIINDDLVKEVKSIPRKIRNMAGTANKLGKGGMISQKLKLQKFV